jgi:hypothetical protein
VSGARVRAAFADLGEKSSLKALADEVSEVDFVVSLAAAPANGRPAALKRDAVTRPKAPQWSVRRIRPSTSPRSS